MKPIYLMLPIVALLKLPGAALAQTGAHDHKADASSAAAPKSGGELSFDALKALAGEWEGKVDVPEVPEMSGGKPMHVTMRVTSRGHTIVHEMQEADTPLDPAKYDHPVTMLYLDSGELTLVHYCDAGNRPRMTGKISPDGRKIEFELKDVSGNPAQHMDHAVFTFLDTNHHIEDWTFMIRDKPIHAHFDLYRKS